MEKHIVLIALDSDFDLIGVELGLLEAGDASREI